MQLPIITKSDVSMTRMTFLATPIWPTLEWLSLWLSPLIHHDDEDDYYVTQRGWIKLVPPSPLQHSLAIPP